MYTIQPSRSRTQPHPGSTLAQFLDLFLIEWTNWRWNWRSMLLSGTITPMFSLVALGVFARDSGRETLAFVMTGNVVVGLLFGTMRSVEGHMTWIRFEGTLDYFATLPVRRFVLVLAITLAFLLFSLPSVAVTIVLGSYLLHVPLTPHPALLVVIPLSSATLAGLGALLGLSGRTRQESGNWSFLITLLMTALGPVIVPPDRLPPFMLALGYLSPSTYAASALRQTLIGPLTGRIVVDLAVLFGMTTVFLWLVGHKMSWRQE